MRPAPTSPQAWSPSAGPSTRTPRLREQRDVVLGRGIRPHQPVHGGCHSDGPIGRETQRREQVVGETVRETREEVCSRRCDEDAIRPARELDVTHRSLGRGVPEVRPHGVARERLERHRRHELTGTGGHHDLHVDVAIAQTTHELGALVGGDAAGDAEQDAMRSR